MNFMEKLTIVEEDSKLRKYEEYLILFLLNKPSKAILGEKLGGYSVPASYKKFLKYTNGAELGAVRFLSIGDDSYFETIESAIKEFDEIYKDFEDEESPFKIGSGNLPIALDSGGNVIYLNKKGEVWIFYIDGGEHQFIASSFKEFMDEVVFGERYRDFFSTLSKWYQYLKLKGWVKE